MSLVEQRKPSREMSSTTLRLVGGGLVVIKNGRRLKIPEGSKRLLVLVTLQQDRFRSLASTGSGIRAGRI
jgi:hypothetical protein